MRIGPTINPVEFHALWMVILKDQLVSTNPVNKNQFKAWALITSRRKWRKEL